MAATNKLNIYLIKEGKTLEQIFKSPIEDLKTIDINDSKLYYNPKQIQVPGWVTDFFKTDFKNEGSRNVFNTTSSQAVLIKNVRLLNKEIIFAITFGNGFHMLNLESYEPNYGLKTVLNIVDPNNLRKIDKHDISATPKHTSEQLSRAGSQIDFNLNIETDILTGVVGSFKKNKKAKILNKDKYWHKIFGTTLSGKNYLSICSQFDIDNINRLLKASYIVYNQKKYQENGFEWIDNIDLVQSNTQLYKDLCDKLDNQLMNLEEESDKIWIAVPEVIKWENIKGFCYKNKHDEIYNDLYIEDLVRYIEGNISIAKLKRTLISARNTDNTKDEYLWNSFECLYAEIDLNNRKYILINTQWYELKNDFVLRTNDKFNANLHKSCPVNFIPCEAQDKEENNYNKRLTESLSNAICLDAKNIPHGGQYSKIEFCDVYDIDNSNLIHVKKYSGSSVLSHLFSQGLVSSELLIDDSSFKEKVINKIKEEKSDFIFPTNPSFNVVFGIIAKPGKNDFEIPFFSKVTLNNIVQKIQKTKGYEAYIKLIPNHTPKKENNAEEANND